MIAEGKIASGHPVLRTFAMAWACMPPSRAPSVERLIHRPSRAADGELCKGEDHLRSLVDSDDLREGDGP